MLSMGLGMIDPNNPITELNSKLHQSDIYNSFQTGVSMVSSFTGAASQNMACFIAGTMVLTAAGLVAIEKIKAGDVVISTNPDTLETAEKPVLETYIRQVDKLVHLTVNGEEIVTTVDHPFYVQGRGFINAGNLLVGDTLINVNGEDLPVSDCIIEDCDSPTTVYNFQVEDYHTYFVGENKVWVHNAGSEYDKPIEPYNRKKHYGNTPTKKDRQVIGGSPDHDPPLVKRYYEGDPNTGEKPGYQMTPSERRASAQDRSRMKPSTRAEQNSQGGQMSKYSKEMKKKYGFDKKD